jgi:hypothetical protein
MWYNFSIKTLKLLYTEDEVTCDFVFIILVYCGEYFVWFDGCVYVFLFVPNLEFLVGRWD